MMESLSGAHLYLDCFAGIAGDMFLGAMIDLGVPEQVIRDGLATLPVTGYRLEVGRRQQMGIDGCDVKVHVAGAEHHHEHEHEHEHEHHHRAYREIRAMIEGADGLPGAATALAIFERLARAEGRMHAMAVEEVTFHEVGALDSIVDIVGAAIALDYLRPARITCRRVPLGHGSTRCAHGVLPVPSPAALEILRGCEVEDGAAGIELCTPTGAAIVATVVDAFGELPSGRVLSVGYGAGDKSLDDRANHLRAVLLAPRVGTEEASAVVIEANIDDMSGELAAHLCEQLLAAGALDAWLTPIVMKKGRPALTVSALCREAEREAIAGLLLAESTSIGLRYRREARRVLGRRLIEVETDYGPIVVKEAFDDSERVLNAAPEYGSCRAAAEDHAVPLKDVYAAALAAHERSRPAAGQRGLHLRGKSK